MSRTREKVYLGIDPGNTGAVVRLCGRKVETYVMPIIEGKFDHSGLTKIFCKFSVEKTYAVCLEEVHAIYGSSASGTFTFGGVFHSCEQVLCDFELPYMLVQPKVWQKEMFQGVAELRKPSTKIKSGPRKGKSTKGRRDTKAMALIAAKRLFPTVDLRATERCKKPHDGIVDAILIAEYCRRKYER